MKEGRREGRRIRRRKREAGKADLVLNILRM
jgi:hypothetical protein